jgi:hypothetical protein
VPIGKQAQIRNVVVCHLSVGRCEYAFRSRPASGALSGVPIGAAYALVVPGGFTACTAGDQDGSGNGTAPIYPTIKRRQRRKFC